MLYSSFHSIIQGCLVFENKKFDRKKYPIEPWMTTAILRKKRKMDNLRKKFLRKNTEKNETAYEIIKGEYSNDIRLAKNKYFGEELYKAHKNSKKLWSTIHQIIHGKTRSQSIEIIKVNDVLITDKRGLRKHFPLGLPTQVMLKL